MGSRGKRRRPTMSVISRIEMVLDLAHVPLFKAMLARLMWWRYRVFTESDKVRFTENLCRIARLLEGNSPGFQERVEREISRSVNACKDQQVPWAAVTESWKPGIIEKAVILKPYLGEKERGVILVSF